MSTWNKVKKSTVVGMAVFATYLASTVPSYAHYVPSAGGGLLAGFIHPFSGLDHLLAMAGVGIWAGQNARTNRAFRWLPLGFVIGMIVGAIFGMAGTAVPFVEMGIAGSVAVLGMIVALGRSVPILPALATVMVFGGFHGFAHGQELPISSDPILYGMGFTVSTVLLHALGFALATLVVNRSWGKMLRIGGGCIAVSGIAMASAIVAG